MNTTKYPLSVATTLVIANMIGTGVFTSLGYQVGPLPSGFAILMLWLVGGIVAISGAFVYAEIATTLKRSGGEYLFLRELYHPVAGFLAGWISFAAGFAGACSAVALAIAAYASEISGISPLLIAIGAICVITSIHLFGIRAGGIAQNILTGIKLTLIVFFCVAPFFLAESASSVRFFPALSDLDLVTSSGFAISLVYVVYAYTGWNAAAYIAGNLENPTRNLPRSLVFGTLVVTVVYLSLNGMFLYSAEMAELSGKNDIGNVVAAKLMGPEIGSFFTLLFSFALLSTLSAMTIAGPRVLEAMGEDFPKLKPLALKNRFGMPFVAILLQAGWSIFLVLFSSFQQIIQYVSVSLSLFSLAAVLGIFILRKRFPPEERPFKTPFFPLPVILFSACTCWMIFFVIWEDPQLLLYLAGSILPGWMLFRYASKQNIIS